MAARPAPRRVPLGEGALTAFPLLAQAANNRAGPRAPQTILGTAVGPTAAWLLSGLLMIQVFNPLHEFCSVFGKVSGQLLRVAWIER